MLIDDRSMIEREVYLMRVGYLVGVALVLDEREGITVRRGLFKSTFVSGVLLNGRIV